MTAVVCDDEVVRHLFLLGELVLVTRAGVPAQLLTLVQALIPPTLRYNYVSVVLLRSRLSTTSFSRSTYSRSGNLSSVAPLPDLSSTQSDVAPSSTAVHTVFCYENIVMN